MLRQLSRLAARAIALGALLLSAQLAGAQQPPVKVGLLVIDSGPFASSAKDMEAAARAAVDILNTEGGVLNRKIELVVQAHSGSPATAQAAAAKLVQQNGVTMITGQLPSSHALALVPRLSALNVLLIDAYSQSTDLMTRSCGANYFRVSTPDPVITALLKEYVKESGAKTWNVISVDYAAGQSFAKNFAEMVSSLGGNVQVSLFSPFGNTDFGTYIAQLSRPADGLMVTLFGADAINFAKQQKQFGLFDKYKHVLGNGFATESELRSMGDNVLGVLNGMSYHNSLPGKRNADYVKAFEQRVKRKPTYPDADLMVALEMLRSAAQKAGSTDVPALKTALEGMKADTIYGNVEMRAADHHLIRQHTLGRVVRTADGKGVEFTVKYVKQGTELYPPPSPDCKP